MDQYIGRLLDNRYEILEMIGSGGMAVVYKARCHRLNRLVAIKILKDEFAMDEEFRRRFHAEGEAVAMLSHPNIVQVYDVSSSDSANYIVMELIDGISLKQYMEKKGVLNWKETLHFSMQICKGLEHAHSRGIVHRDIKPHNVMVLKNGSVKVMDFGIARVMNKSNTLTKEALGSVHYISPEQAKGGHTDNRSDLYSLGVVMYEMMTGRPPYDGESAVAVAIQHINGGAPLPSTLNPNIPKGMEQIIMKAMALDVRDRYVSATEMLQDMEEFRKNPAIVFDHKFLMDDATRAIPSESQHRPQTTAEKKVQAKTGVRPTSDTARLRQSQERRKTGTVPTVRTAPAVSTRETDSIRRTQQRRKAEIRKKEEERSRVATTAIVICSAVAVIAIVIFLVALFNGVLLDRERDYVEVPYLEGERYDENFAATYSDFNIRLMPQQYHDTYEEGQIISQQPAGGEKVQRGTDLWITVSMGPEPETKTMDDFAVSSGPAVVTATMPEVVGKDLELVKELMTQLGFQNVRYDPMESQKPKNEVIYQSVSKDTELDVTSEVIIQYSEGPAETQPPETTESTQDKEITITYPVDVPDRQVEYRLEVYLKGSTEVLTSKLVPPGTTRTYVDLTGSGTMEFDLYVDGAFLRTQTVEFTEESGDE